MNFLVRGTPDLSLECRRNKILATRNDDNSNGNEDDEIQLNVNNRASSLKYKVSKYNIH